MNIRTHLCATTLALALTAIAWLPGEAAAAEKSAVNPVGSWKVSYPKSQSAFTPILKLKLQGDKLSGTLTRAHNQTTIEMNLQGAKLKGNEISFTVTIPPVSGNGPSATRTFRGTISGESMRGTAELEWAGQTSTQDWEAKRIKE